MWTSHHLYFSLPVFCHRRPIGVILCFVLCGDFGLCRDHSGVWISTYIPWGITGKRCVCVYDYTLTMAWYVMSRWQMCHHEFVVLSHRDSKDIDDTNEAELLLMWVPGIRTYQATFRGLEPSTEALLWNSGLLMHGTTLTCLYYHSDSLSFPSRMSGWCASAWKTLEEDR